MSEQIELDRLEDTARDDLDAHDLALTEVDLNRQRTPILLQPEEAHFPIVGCLIAGVFLAGVILIVWLATRGA